MSKKTIPIIVGILFISFVVYYRWISFNVFAGGDWYFYLSNSLKNSSFNYVWLNITGFGSINFTLWRHLVNSLQSFLAGLGYASNVSGKLFIVWPTIIFANIFALFLFKKILKSNLAAFIGVLVFNYNTYYLAASSAFLLYAASPWVLISLLIFINALETGKKYLFVISGLTLFIAGSYDFRVAYIGAFILLFYALYYFFFIKNLKISVGFLKMLFSPFISFLIFGLLNIFWVLPMLKLGSLTSNPVLDRGLFGNEFLNILYSIAFFHPFWTGTKLAWFTVEPIMVYFWLIPIFAFLGLYFNRKNKNVLFFGIVALFGVFLTKQVAHPFSNVYPWLYDHLIGFNAFREASKFYFLIALGYAVLIGAFVKYIFENFKKTKIYFKYIFVVFIAFLFLWNTKPILTGEISGVFIPRHMPNDYLIVNNFILKDKGYYRTLWVPTDSTWSIYTPNHPIVSIASVLSEYNYWVNYANKLPINKYSEGQLMIKSLMLPLSNNLLDVSSIKYVFVPIRDIANDDDFFVFYGEPRQYYIDQLDRISYLHRISIGTKDIIVYENYNYRPHIYITNKQESINKSKPFTKIDDKFIDPTQYTFSIKNISTPFYLNFSESYNTGWNIRAGSFNWFSVLTNKNYFITSNNHFQNDANLNSFYFDPVQVCKQFSCLKNKNGSYDINLTLYFAPQSYMYLGLIISGGVLIVALGYLLFIFGKYIYARKI